MIFVCLDLSADGVVTARAVGHPDEVIEAFHSVSSLLLGTKGAWRMTEVKGVCADDTPFESDMTWYLTSKLKNKL